MPRIWRGSAPASDRSCAQSSGLRIGLDVPGLLPQTGRLNRPGQQHAFPYKDTLALDVVASNN